MRGLVEVQDFSKAMLHELKENEHKGNWKTRSIPDSVWDIWYHLLKLTLEVTHGDTKLESVQEFSADVANCAMMLSDKLGALKMELPDGRRTVHTDRPWGGDNFREDVQELLGFLRRMDLAVPEEHTWVNSDDEVAE